MKKRHRLTKIKDNKPAPDNTMAEFELYLTRSKGVSRTTLKNYLSDLRHFLSWLEIKLAVKKKLPLHSPSKPQTTNYQLQNLEPSLLQDYKKYLLSNNIAKSTINRRLAALRVFCQFCYNKGLLKQDLSKNLTGLSQKKPAEEKINDLVSKFGLWLKKQKASKNTIKNYTADVRAYLLFQAQSGAFADFENQQSRPKPNRNSTLKSEISRIWHKLKWT